MNSLLRDAQGFRPAGWKRRFDHPWWERTYALGWIALYDEKPNGREVNRGLLDYLGKGSQRIAPAATADRGYHRAP